MKNLIRKELLLTIHPAAWLLAMMSLLIFVPSYPNTVFVLYLMTSLVLLFNGIKENKDDLYMASLPVRKRDAVKARFSSIVIYQCLSILLALVAVLVIRFFLLGKEPYGSVKQLGDGVGMAASLAFIGMSFFIIGVCDLIFLPWHYRSGGKMLAPMLVSLIVGVALCFGVEAFGSLEKHGPESIRSFIHLFNVIETDTIVCQLIVLFGGIVLYGLFNFLAYKLSAKHYELRDL